MGDGEELVLLLGEGLLDLVELGAATDLAGELGDVGAVGGEAVGEAIAKVASAQDEDIVAGLGQVGGNEIPTESTRAGDDEGLSRGVGGLEELSGQGEGLSKDGDERGSDMAFTVREDMS